MALTKATLIDLNANELILDLDADTSITADTDDTINIKIGGSDEITITGTALSPSTSDGNSLGTSALEWSDLFLADGAVINFGDDQDVSLTHVADTGLLLSSTDQLQFGDSGTYIHQSADGVLDLVSDTEIEINATTIDINGNVDISGTITIGSAAITEAELEQIDGITAGTVIASKAIITDANKDITGGRNITISGELDAATGDFSGDVDIDGTANLDVVDIDGATQIDATVTVGVDDTGYDVKFFGATSGAYMLWDESVDDLILAGAARAVVPEGNLVLGSTAVTSTAAELNLLDGVSGLVQADLTKLAAVDSTAAELNIVDGGTSATATTVADADRVVMNDNGTMVQVAVTDLAAYFDDEITAMPNLVTTAATTVGALDSGSITSGFGTIDTGSSTITTTGDITGGTFAATGDTAAGDNASIGYTAAEGLILTGQGSTSDITLKNDADAVVFTVPTGTDDILFPDNAKAMFGDGSDLQIYHDASNSLVKDTGTGGLFLCASQVSLRNAANNETGLTFAENGALTLFHDNSSKLATSANGITVNGTAVATTDTDTSNTGSVTLDFAANQNFVLTLTGNVTLANPSTEQVGQSGFIAFIQDGTGSRTVSLGTDYETAAAAGLTLTSTASATDLVPYLVVASGRILLGTPQLAFA